MLDALLRMGEEVGEFLLETTGVMKTEAAAGKMLLAVKVFTSTVRLKD